jgi:uncharacterized protein YggL (DUF469 family)
MSEEVEFSFVVQRADGGDISEEQMNRLLDSIIDVVEAEGMGMGGGCRPLIFARECPRCDYAFNEANEEMIECLKCHLTYPRSLVDKKE